MYNPTPFVYPTTTSAPTSVSTPRVSGAGINFPAANAATSTVSQVGFGFIGLGVVVAVVF
ncbi:hypothetical protein FRB99_002543, partial [Tulasnella sp. 403]